MESARKAVRFVKGCCLEGTKGGPVSFRWASPAHVSINVQHVNWHLLTMDFRVAIYIHHITSTSRENRKPKTKNHSFSFSVALQSYSTSSTGTSVSPDTAAVLHRQRNSKRSRYHSSEKLFQSQLKPSGKAGKR